MGEPLRPHVETAMRTWQRIYPTAPFSHPYSFVAVQQIAATLADHSRPKDSPCLEFTPDNFIRSEEELKAIRPLLEDLRLKVFGKSVPPFKDLTQALSGIKKMAREYVPDRPGSIGIASLPIAGHDIIVAADSPLGLLAKETAYLDEETSFPQASLVAFIAIGIKPVARVYRINTKMKLISLKGRPPGSKSIPLTLDNLDTLLPISLIDLRLYRPLTDRELFSLVKSLRDRMKPPRKRLSRKALRLYRFFEEIGGPPEHEKMKYWESAFIKWRRLYPKDEIRSATSLRIARERLNRAISSERRQSSIFGN